MAGAPPVTHGRGEVALLFVSVHGFNLRVSSGYVAFSGFTGFGDASGLIAGFIQDRVARSANFGQWSISCPCVRRPQISRDSLAWMTE